jgi:trigger factor
MDQQNETATENNIVTIEEAGPCRKKVLIEIPRETVDSVTEEQFKTLGKDAEIPGFRKGRAPRRLLERRFGKEISEQVKLKLIADASEASVKDNKIDALKDPDIDHEKIEVPTEGPMKFEFEVEVRPEFELPELEGIAVERKIQEVTDEQVDTQIEQLRKWSGIWAPREEGEKIQADDQIIADVVMKVEDVEEEEKLNNTEIFVRANGFVGSIPVPELDKLLIGAKAGDTKETNVEVPQTYFREEYRGKKVDIKISIEDVKWIKPAEINEEFLARYSVENEAEFRERIHENLQSQLEQQARSGMSDQIYKYMLDNTTFDLPLSIVADQAVSILRRQHINMMQKGVPREMLEQQFEQLQAQSEEQAREQLKTFFIMDKVAEKLEIDVSQEEINGHIAQQALQQGQRPEKLREQMERDGSLAQFTLQVRETKCIEKLLESAKVTEVKAKKAPKKTAKKAAKTEKKSTEDNKKKAKKSVKSAKKTEKKAAEAKKTNKKTKTKTKKKTDK